MEEKKTYSISGVAFLGADEYRDLIESVWEANKEVDRLRSELDDAYRVYRQAIIERDGALHSVEERDNLMETINKTLRDDKDLRAEVEKLSVALAEANNLLESFLDDNDLWGEYVAWEDKRVVATNG